MRGYLADLERSFKIIIKALPATADIDDELPEMTSLGHEEAEPQGEAELAMGEDTGFSRPMARFLSV